MGTAAEYAVIPSEKAARLPDNTRFDEGACLGVPAMTAHRCVFADGSVNGQTILVTGGAGAVGYYALQLAEWGGATVFATVSRPEQAELVKAAGADHIINYKTEDVVQRIEEITGAEDGRGIDRIVDVNFTANLPVTLFQCQHRNSVEQATAQPRVCSCLYLLEVPLANYHLNVARVAQTVKRCQRGKIPPLNSRPKRQCRTAIMREAEPHRILP